MQAKDVMTRNVVTVSPEDNILRAIRLMLQHRISGLPVIDNGGQLLGIVTEGDFLRRTEIGTTARPPRWIEFLMGPGALAADYVHVSARKVGDVMTADVHSVDEDASLQDAVDLMERYHIKRVPVLRQNILAGIIGRGDILRTVASAGLATAKAAKSTGDSQIRQQLIDYLERQPWAPTGTINATVNDGIVTFTGTIFDERERDALRVAAENIPGVKGVTDEMVWIDPVSGYVGDPPSAA